MTLNLVDALLALVILVGAYGGFRRGFVYAALDLLTLAVSLAAAFLAYRYPSAWLQKLAPDPYAVWAAPFAFVLLFFLVHYLLGAATLAIAQKAPAPVHRTILNRLLGLAPGFVNGGMYAVVMAVVLLTVPLGPVSRWAHNSALALSLGAPAEWMESRMAPIFDPAIKQTMQALTMEPTSRTRVDLRFKVENAKVRTDLEERMLEMVNVERESQGLKPLQGDPQLSELARGHSRDMFKRGYFSHLTPDGRDLHDRLRTARLGYLTAGENLALAPTLTGAHQGLMNSPGHRANILRPQFGRLGIGILDGGAHGLMVTQNFRN